MKTSWSAAGCGACAEAGLTMTNRFSTSTLPLMVVVPPSPAVRLHPINAIKTKAKTAGFNLQFIELFVI
jgi:hypothetical protein